MEKQLNIVKSAIDHRMKMLLMGLNNLLDLNSEKTEYTKTISLDVLQSEIEDDLVIFVGEKVHDSLKLDMDFCKDYINDLANTILNNVEIEFTETDMIITVRKAAVI